VRGAQFVEYYLLMGDVGDGDPDGARTVRRDPSPIFIYYIGSIARIGLTQPPEGVIGSQPVMSHVTRA
jgi:hypothetical protein